MVTNTEIPELHVIKKEKVKLLQSEYVLSVMVCLFGYRREFSFTPVLPLLALARTTAECYWSAHHRLESILGWNSTVKFVRGYAKRVEYLVCTDADGAGLKNERGRATMDPGAGVLGTRCFVHRTNAARTDTLNLEMNGITTLRRAVLALRFSSNYRLFRVGLKRVIGRRVWVSRDNNGVSSLSRAENERRSLV